ncbi:MAG: NifU family protein [Pseudomonadota bacterium]
MFIQIEETPNPATLKFLPGRTILEAQTIDFPSAESARICPLAQQLFAIEGVAGIFVGADFISVTKEAPIEWVLLKPPILQALVNYFVLNEKVVLERSKNNDSGNQTDSTDQEVVQEIKELLDSKVRPAVAMDGGDIQFERFENGVVYLKMQGACSGCPSSSATLKGGIENMLRYYIPEVTEVCEVEG